MNDADERETGAGASVAALAFALAIAFLASTLLAIVGADARVAVAVAPLAALAAASALGPAQVAWTSTAFLGRERRAPGASGAGIAFATGALALALFPETRGALAEWTAPACALAAALAPWVWRAVSGIDGLAERFPHAAARMPIALAAAAVGFIAATAGIAVASEAFAAGVTHVVAAQQVLIGGALLLSAAPGGGRGVVAGDSASAVFLASVAAAAVIFAFATGQHVPSLSSAPLALRAPPPLQAIALTLAVATSPLLAPHLGPNRGGYDNLRFSLVAALYGAAGLAAIALDSGRSTSFAGEPATRAGVQVLLGLSLARAGVFAVARTLAYDLPWSPRARIHLASLRLSWMRLAMIAAGVVALGAARRSPLAVDEPLLTALAASLAIFPPLLALAFFPRAGSAAAFASLAAGGCALFLLAPRPFPFGAALFETALESAALALASGFVVAIALPTSQGAPRDH